MKISEYIRETNLLSDQFEILCKDKSNDEYSILDFFDSIEYRQLNIEMWFSCGLKDTDDVPESINRAIDVKW